MVMALLLYVESSREENKVIKMRYNILEIEKVFKLSRREDKLYTQYKLQLLHCQRKKMI